MDIVRRSLVPITVLLAISAVVAGILVFFGRSGGWRKVDYKLALDGAWRYLLVTGCIVFAYRVARVWVTNESKNALPASLWWRTRCYVRWVLACGVLAFIFVSSLGTHTEYDDSDDDPLRGGGGYSVRDYIPTDQEQIGLALAILLCGLVPGLLGTHEGIGQVERGNVGDEG